MVLSHFPPNADLAEVSEHLRRFGYAIVDDVVGSATMDQVEAEVMPFLEASDAGRDEYDGRFTRRAGALLARCPTARELIMHPVAVDTVSHFLSHVSAVQLHLTQIISVEPRCRRPDRPAVCPSGRHRQGQNHRRRGPVQRECPRIRHRHRRPGGVGLVLAGLPCRHGFDRRPLS